MPALSIQDFPNELLLTIFHAAVDPLALEREGNDDLETYSSALCNLILTCKHWKTLVYSEGSFWAYVDVFTPENIAQRWEEMRGSALLSVYRVWNGLENIAYRCKRLTLAIGGRPNHERIRQFLMGPLPHLEELHLNWFTTGGDPGVLPLFENYNGPYALPSLRSLSLQCIMPSWTHASLWAANLEELDLNISHYTEYPTVTDVITLLKECRKLRSLELKIYRCDDDQTILQTKLIIELPHLTRLRVDCGEAATTTILAVLLLPKLEAIWLTLVPSMLSAFPPKSQHVIKDGALADVRSRLIELLSSARRLYVEGSVYDQDHHPLRWWYIKETQPHTPSWKIFLAVDAGSTSASFSWACSILEEANSISSEPIPLEAHTLHDSTNPVSIEGLKMFAQLPNLQGLYIDGINLQAMLRAHASERDDGSTTGPFPELRHLVVQVDITDSSSLSDLAERFVNVPALSQNVGTPLCPNDSLDLLVIAPTFDGDLTDMQLNEEFDPGTFERILEVHRQAARAKRVVLATYFIPYEPYSTKWVLEKANDPDLPPVVVLTEGPERPEMW